MLDGIGSELIYNNLTLTDLSVGRHILMVGVSTETWFFSETVHFNISQTIGPAPSLSSSPSPTPEHTISVDPNFSLYTGLALLIMVVVTFVGLLVYFRKHKH